jgi:hypothetical protein
MNVLPVLVSYRRVDGSDIAHWLRESLNARSITQNKGSLQTVSTLSVYLDRAQPAVSDWELSLSQELERARALIVVCTPGAKYEFGPDDCLYRELRWWLENRATTAPILVSKPQFGVRWVPDLISSKWPKAQLVTVDLEGDGTLLLPKLEAEREMSIQSIIGGIAANVGGDTADELNLLSLDAQSESDNVNQPGLYMWQKDKHFRYIGCNDNYARSAGFDSPRAMIGKTDDDMPWRSLADFFRAGDQQVISGLGPIREHVMEKEIMVDGVADILVTENQIQDRRGECLGVTGYYIDVTGYQLIPRRTPCDIEETGLSLGKEFGNETFSSSEIKVFKGMLKRYDVKKIAGDFKLRHAVVKSCIRSIKRKLQCTTDGDVIATAIRSGLPLTLFGPDKK